MKSDLSKISIEIINLLIKNKLTLADSINILENVKISLIQSKTENRLTKIFEEKYGKK